jgi:hypothetical protein
MTGTVHDILRRAESIGIRLRLEGDRLKASLPDSDDPGVLEVAYLKHAQVLEELRREEEPVPYSRNARRLRQIANRRIDRSRF